jgi:hypothetical protein
VHEFRPVLDMACIRVSATAQRCLLAFVLTSAAAGCAPDEPPTPFKRVFRSSVESSTNRGFMWVAKKRDQPDPDGRYEGGYDLDFHAGLGVCRMRHEGGVHPGKVFAGKCNAGYGHQEVSSAEYDLLVARQDAFWHMAPKPGMDLEKALIAGREADDKPLKLCVARHQTGWWLLSNHRGYHPGKYVHGKCNFGFGGQEVAADDFYLVAFGSKPGATGTDGGTPDAGSSTTEEPKAGALGRADAAGGDAASGTDASVPREEKADAAAAVVSASVNVASRTRAAPVRPVRCLTGEVACHCEKVSGCALEGYCPCSP